MTDVRTTPGGGWITLTAASAAAVIVGFVSTILVVMKGAEGAGANLDQQASVAASLCYAMALTSLYLCWRHRMPLIVAWSTPGAALLAGTSATALGVTFPDAIGAFILAGILMVLTAFVAPLARAIERMPGSVAAAMLAGVLFKFVIAVPAAAIASPLMVLPLIVVYVVLKLCNSLYAVPAVVALGLLLVVLTGKMTGDVPLQITALIFTWPTWNLQAAISIAVPLYLVTMASQNLPGFAVQRANGYHPPVASCLASTGIGSILAAPFGSHAVNLAAITASLVAGPDAHPKSTERWKAVFPYFILYLVFGLAAATFVSTLSALPQHVITAIAGLALFGPTSSGVAAMVKEQKDIDAAFITFCVTASGIVLWGVGAAFWGLVAGLVTLAIRTQLNKVRQ